jgi:hypothetical protein
MSSIEISFDLDSGLIFSRIENGNKVKAHEVSLGTLNQMSLSDLDYCLSTNVIVYLFELHAVFSDYLWTKDGEIEPRKARDAPR